MRFYRQVTTIPKFTVTIQISKERTVTLVKYYSISEFLPFLNAKKKKMLRSHPFLYYLLMMLSSTQEVMILFL